MNFRNPLPHLKPALITLCVWALVLMLRTPLKPLAMNFIASLFQNYIRCDGGGKA
jgi:hypothetical protein